MSPILARILAGRGLSDRTHLAGALTELQHYRLLKGAVDAAGYLAECIQAKRRILIVADYDCDGATACAVALRGLRAFGAHVDFCVPDRMEHGYGLTRSIIDLVATQVPRPDVLVTVDNGIASHEGVERAGYYGMDVVVTDHHLPSKLKPLPSAAHIVDPSQPGCEFPSKNLAGCGVIWYVLWALQDIARERKLPVAPGFKVSSLLPLVAVGTVADVVTLDRNNRILVQAGLDAIRTDGDKTGGIKTFPGIDALATVGYGNTCNPRNLVTSDIAFGLGPRVNAAGRMKTMDPGIRCLATDDPIEAVELAKNLAELNGVRQQKEHDIADEAFNQAFSRVHAEGFTIAVHDATWHAGVIGIVAGRIKERLYRPTFVLTTDSETKEIKGSGRSIPGVHLKDLLDLVDKQNPGLLRKFGGHAMAAGVTLRPGGADAFRLALEQQAQTHLTLDVLHQVVETDGSLAGQDLSLATAKELLTPPWGQGFSPPVFCDEFLVISAKLDGVNKDRLSMQVARGGVTLPATSYRFAGDAPKAGSQAMLVYKLSVDRDRKGKESLRLLVDCCY